VNAPEERLARGVGAVLCLLLASVFVGIAVWLATTISFVAIMGNDLRQRFASGGSAMHGVRTVSAYLDGEVTQEQRRRIDDHLEGCQGCRAALEQFRTAIRSTGRLKPEDAARINPLIRDRLIAMLRIPRRR
jgi:hypothetical protein